MIAWLINLLLECSGGSACGDEHTEEYELYWRQVKKIKKPPLLNLPTIIAEISNLITWNIMTINHYYTEV